MADLNTVNEGATCLYEATLRDETGAVIIGTALDSLTLTVYDVLTRAIVNERNHQDVFNKNGVTISAEGVLRWVLTPADNVMIGTGPERRRAAMFVAVWASQTKSCPHEFTWLIRNLTYLPQGSP